MRAKQFLVLILLVAFSCSQILTVQEKILEYEQTPQNQKPPCERISGCGDVSIFQNENEFRNFIAKYRPLFYYDYQAIYRNFVSDSPKSFITYSDMAKTLVQKADEADLLKTDGTYIYTFSNKILSIILAYPSNQAKVISKLNFKDNPSALFIQGNYLAVLGTRGSAAPFETFIQVYDVSNKRKPKLVKEFRVSGRYLDAKKLENGLLYLVSSYQFQSAIIPEYDIGQGPRQVNFTSIFWYPYSNFVNPAAFNILSFNLKDPIASQKNIITICSEFGAILRLQQQHIYMAVFNYYEGYTEIKKIFVSENQIQPFADGFVWGMVKDKFSLSQYKKLLRVATINFKVLNFNSVYVLNYTLKSYGILAGIAPNQQITLCKFVGRRLYLTTSKRTNSFLVINFKSHKSPQILGELKLSGLLYPYDETMFIGFNQKGGLKLSTLDVSDVSQPKQSAKFELEERYASSTAEWEHKAFLFSADRNLLVIPARMDSNGDKFNGAFTFYITKTQIVFRSAINHLLNPADDFSLRDVERSLWINELLYTKSKCLLRINQISQTFAGVKLINIPCNQSDFETPKPV